MTVHAISIMHNEEKLLPYFLRHYSTFADKIFIFNDHSTDKTVEIAAVNPKVQILDFEYNDGLNELHFNECFINAYKRLSRGVADWVMIVDGDEFIHNDDIIGVLEAQRQMGRRALKTTGYRMISQTFPTTTGQIYEECRHGLRARDYDKVVIFDPTLDITFEQGRHSTNLPEGIKYYRAKLGLLHYQYLSREYYVERYTESFNRRSTYTEKYKYYKMKWGLVNFDEKNLEKVV